MDMDVDNHMLLEKYFSTHNSPYEKTFRVSKHTKFANPQTFEKVLLQLYSECGTNNLPAIYKVVHESFMDQEMTLSHSENYKHIYAGVCGDYDIEAAQTHFFHPIFSPTFFHPNFFLTKTNPTQIYFKKTFF